MDTSDRQIAETGRNRELGLIPAMVSGGWLRRSVVPVYRSRHYMSAFGAA